MRQMHEIRNNRLRRREIESNKRFSYISLLINLLMLILAIIAALSAYYSASDTRESLNILRNTSRWYEEPRPLIINSSDFDYYNRNVELRIVPPDLLIYEQLWSEVVPIKVTIYNSGRAPLVSSRLYINLTADNLRTVFPFKIYKVETPLENFSYDEFKKFFYMSHDYMGRKFKIPIQEDDYPPHLKYGRVYYWNIISTKASEWSEKRTNVAMWELEIGAPFGPFKIGTIEPEKKVEIIVWLFAITDGDSEPHKGNLKLIINSENLAPIFIEYQLKAVG